MATTELLYIHPGLQLTDLDGGRGRGYVASRSVRRGELLLQERPVAWSSGSDPLRPDLAAGVDWLLRSGAVHELPAGPTPTQGFPTLRDRAAAVAARCAFRHQSPCADGSYVAMLFRASSRFNHSCFPNAGAHAADCAGVPSADAFAPEPCSTFALEDISKGEEVCICYLSEADQLSPARSRQAVLLDGWGFTCECRRCKSGRPLDQKLEGFAEDIAPRHDLERRRLAASASREYRALFDPSAEDYAPPTDDFEAAVRRLTGFREAYRLLDRAHMAMQRVRRELLAALLLDGPDGPISRRHAPAAAALLVEEMSVLHELLPLLSPCKVPLYLRFVAVLRTLPEEEARWLRRDAKVDGCELWHRNAVWLHSPREAEQLQLEGPLNLPPRPAPGPPPRTGPRPGLGGCSAAGASFRRPARCTCTAAVAVNVADGGGLRWTRRRGRPRPRRAAEADDEMPALVGWLRPEPPRKDVTPLPAASVAAAADLWDAYGEYGRPSAAARGLRRAAATGAVPLSAVAATGAPAKAAHSGAGAAALAGRRGAAPPSGVGGPSWFKFRV